MADDDHFGREIRHRENTKWKYGLTRQTRGATSSITSTHQTDITPIAAIGRLVSLAYITRDLSRIRGFGNRNFEFGIFSVLFVIIWVYQNFWVCYICLGFFTHIALGK